jgi:alkylation response protein AidB-like acyl-CoA dehydrogenase
MSVELSDIQESARQIAADLGLAASEEKTWPLIVELGLMQVVVPEALGGLGQGLAGACALYRELGASLASGPYLAAMLAIDAICASERTDREAWVEKLAAGEFVTASLAQAALQMSGKRASGSLSAVLSADKASHVLALSNDCIALVPLSHDKVKLAHRPTFDGTRRLFDVRVEGLELTDDLVLATGAAAQQLAQRFLSHRDFALAADAVGGANASLTATVEYLQGRRQFARPLAMFQALKHRCADLKMQTAAADALLTDSLGRVDWNDLDTAQRLGEAVKLLACTTYSRMVEESLQLHGGIGMTAEFSVHLFLKRALLDEQLGRGGDTYEQDLAAQLLAG